MTDASAERDPAGGAVHYERLLAELQGMLAAVLPAAPRLREDPTGEPSDRITIGDLVRTGAIALRQAPAQLTTGEGEHPVLTARDVRLGRGPSGTASDTPGAVCLQPGDVVTPLAPATPAVLVVTDARAWLGHRLYLLRPDPARIDPHFLAAFLRLTREPSRGAGSSFVHRADIRRIRIPDLPIAAQRAYGSSFRQLLDFEAVLREALSRGEEMVRAGFLGLAEGALRPPSIYD